MITTYIHKTKNLQMYDLRGLSTDSKPTSGVPNGATFIEIDTGKGYLYDIVSNVWHEIPEGSSVVINPASGVSF